MELPGMIEDKKEMCEQDVPRKMTRKKVTILMDSFAQCLNMKQEEKKKTCRIIVQHKPQLQFTSQCTESTG